MKASMNALFVVVVTMMTVGCAGYTPAGLNMEVRSSVSARGEGLPGKLFGRLAQGTHNAIRTHVCGGRTFAERRSARYSAETDRYYDSHPRVERIIPATRERTFVRGELRC